ncbi:uracil-DNA glycosylase [Pigmentiphaga aceris]|uniref:Uracil-DNA glycosylase n=1 Tax=Pigmentiphaga aceris TaxID=1940612 RepID=A0A5C0AXD6_9BURK|nr:uracil-DNA glycosylase [Pigmentiphaga aceris]QEI05017.1 uracil-DNA glycosylase [Pigmentiphaga aceris]
MSKQNELFGDMPAESAGVGKAKSSEAPASGAQTIVQTVKHTQPNTSSNRLVQPLASFIPKLPADWADALAPVLQGDAFDKLAAHVDACVARGTSVYPADPFHALRLTPLSSVRVLILGQDPYHGPDQAQGLAFSVPTAAKRPPSLRNIFNEIAAEFGGVPGSFDNDLTRWAKQGVLLLNTVLTVEDGAPASHAKRGWERITDAVIEQVAQHAPTAFLLWGAHAQSKRALIPADHGHLVLTSNHPSPLSARRPPEPFLGCGHFAKVDDWLQSRNESPIAWR